MSSKRSYTRNTSTKARKKEAFNIHHPDLVDAVEPAFKVGTTQYYRFKDDYRMPVGRYKYVHAFLREVDLRMDLATLKAYVSELKNCLNGAKKVIDIEGAWKIVFSLETRTELAFEPETVKRLASVTYFDETEDLSTYDRKHAKDKINKWNKSKSLDFFLTRPISDLLGLSGISITSLEDYLTTSTEIIKNLAYVPPKQSQENSSENGRST